MKIFNKDIAAYEREPEVRHVAEDESDRTIDIDIDLVDMPYEYEFIQIPNSGHKISTDYLGIDGETIVTKTYAETLDIIKKINEYSSDKYRLPMLPELTSTYFGIDDKDFKNSITRREYTMDIIRLSYSSAFEEGLGDEIFRKTDIWIDQFGDIQGTFDDGMPIEIPGKSGFVKKWNEWGLPKKIGRITTLRRPVYYKAPDRKDDKVLAASSRPVIRDWVPGKCMTIILDYEITDVTGAAIRLVRTHEA